MQELKQVNCSILRIGKSFRIWMKWIGTLDIPYQKPSGHDCYGQKEYKSGYETHEVEKIAAFTLQVRWNSLARG